MKIMYPSISKGLVNFYSSLEKFFGIETKYSSLRVIDQILREEDYKNIIVLAYKGLSSNLLDMFCLEDNILSNNKVIDITTTLDVALKDGGDYQNKCFDNYIDNINKKDKYRAYGVYPYVLDSYDSKIDIYDRIYNMSLFEDKKVIFGCSEELYQVLKEDGFDKEEIECKLELISNNIANLREKLDNSLILVMGDCGFIEPKYINLFDYSEISSVVSKINYINSRICSIELNNCSVKDFTNLFTQLFDGQFVVLSDKNKIKSFLPDFKGDCLIVAVSDFSFYCDDIKTSKVVNGGFSEQEMMVPVIAIKKKLHKELVRKARIDDFSFIKDVMNGIQKNRALSRKDIFVKTDWIDKSEFLNLCERFGDSCCLVYEINDKVVGFIIAKSNSSYGKRKYLEHTYLSVKAIYVLEEYRRKQIATKMYKELQRIAKKLRYKRIEFSLWYFDKEVEKFIFTLNPRVLYTIYETDL